MNNLNMQVKNEKLIQLFVITVLAKTEYSLRVMDKSFNK